MLTLSAPTLASSIACTTSYCYGTDPNSHTVLVRMQDAANAVAAKIGIRDRIVVDGKIGQKTADLIQLIAVSLTDVEAIRGYWASSFKEIAADGSTLLGILQQLATTQTSSQPTGIGPTLPTPTGTGSRPPSVLSPDVLVSAAGIAPVQNPTSTSLPPATPVLVPQVPTKYLIGAAAGGVALLVGGIALAMRRASSGAVAGVHQRKTRDVFVVEQNWGYGHGWEVVTTETDRDEIRKRYREYLANQPSVPTRWRKKRERLSES